MDNLVQTLLNEMVGCNIMPDVFTFNILVDTLYKEGKAEDAHFIVEQKMIRCGVKPNVVTFNSLIDGYCLRGELDEAKNVVELMVSKGCTPDVISFNNLINGYCKSKRTDEALKLFDEMRCRGLSPNVVTYTTLLHCLCQEGQLRGAKMLFEEMYAHGNSPDIVTYNTLLAGLCKHGDLDKATELFREIQKSNLRPTLTTYHILIDGMCKAGRLKRAIELLSGLSRDGLKSNVYTHTILIGGFCKEGLVNDAYKMFRKMEEDGCSPSSCSYNVMIRGFLHDKDASRGAQLITEMRGRGFSADNTTLALLLGWLVLLFPNYCRLACSSIFLSHLSMAASRAVIVAQDGSGDFRTVQDAIDAAVPLSNACRVMIRVSPGVYRQPIYVPKTKNFITLAGLRPEDTVLTWNNTATKIDHHQSSRLIGTGTFGCGSVIVEGEDFIAENITFENSSPQGSGQAVAIRVTADRCAFYNCRFLGWQDTLYLHYGKQYLKDCYIEGSVDFIFGNSTSLLEHCHIHCKSEGYITAQSRKSSQESTGYVFLRCVITGNGGTSYAYLGRPWGPSGRVVFAYTYMDQCVKHVGWNNWGKAENERTACFYEYRCFGPGSCPSKRVTWARELMDEEVDQFLMHYFIDPEPEKPWLAQ